MSPDESFLSGRQAAETIWRAGLLDVLPARFMAESLDCRVQGDDFFLSLTPNRPFSNFSSAALSADFSSASNDFDISRPQRAEWRLSPAGRLIVVGFGKASGAMAAALEEKIASHLSPARWTGWVNVPDDLVRPLRSIRLYGGRPAGRNEPTEAGRRGAEKIVELIERAGPDDLIVALISGGGSALFPLPIPEISLDEKGAVTAFLSGAGANIVELNAVRGVLSRGKGGKLRRLARGKRLVSLVLSDVLGNPLETIAGGPTVHSSKTAADALAVLRKYGAFDEISLARLCRTVETLAEREKTSNAASNETSGYEGHTVSILADNRRAVRAAADCAKRYCGAVSSESAAESEGKAEEVGRTLLERIRALGESAPRQSGALISGGEPVVELVPRSKRGLGGRNTQLVLAALIEVLRRPRPEDGRLVFLSAGTDGEDGPTDAAGAFFDAAILRRVREKMAESPDTFRPEDFLARNDAYTFFQSVGSLLQTGPTGTNVCDLRVALLESPDRSSNNSDQ